jgi:tetratricopeptide (TPR) repeat protein
LTSSARSNAAVVAAALALTACAGAPQLPAGLPAVELTSVPFFPQTEYQCGPAALATVLAHEGVAVTADDLVREVYAPGLRGSLQPELLGATRRHGLVPYVIEPDAAALAAELAAGKPVLVLQNLGIDRVPVWHYAVVVGLGEDEVILRSGTEQRRIERSSHFLRSWRRGDNWAFVALPPGELAATATAGAYVRALAGAESMLDSAAAERGYRAALERWPADELVLFASAGHRYGAGDLRGAAALYRRLLDVAPQHAAARNNLANVLAELGCSEEALAEARAALAALAPGDELGDAVRDTVAELERGAATSPGTAAAVCR